MMPNFVVFLLLLALAVDDPALLAVHWPWQFSSMAHVQQARRTNIDVPCSRCVDNQFFERSAFCLELPESGVYPRLRLCGCNYQHDILNPSLSLP